MTRGLSTSSSQNGGRVAIARSEEPCVEARPSAVDGLAIDGMGAAHLSPSRPIVLCGCAATAPAPCAASLTAFLRWSRCVFRASAIWVRWQEKKNILTAQRPLQRQNSDVSYAVQYSCPESAEQGRCYYWKIAIQRHSDYLPCVAVERAHGRKNKRDVR